MAACSVLPVPRNAYVPPELPDRPAVAAVARKEPPPYGQRQGFVPRSVEDFGDGGAFPEIHVAQYPLDMGRKGKATSTALVPVQVDNETGKIRYDALLNKGATLTALCSDLASLMVSAPGTAKVVHSTYKDLIPAEGLTADDLQRPGPDAEKETTEKTKAALERLVSGKIASSKPAQAVGQTSESYVRYTPAGGPTQGEGAPQQRIIRLVETVSDPLEPPKHKHKKTVRGPPSPPVPVMRSPPRKVTAKDQADWKIPPCISNWKNSKGYTIALDKRLAADGRGLQEVVISDGFAKLSESLYIAERNAREEVEKRNQIAARTAAIEREKKDKVLQDLAVQARQERAQIQELEAEVMAKAADEAPQELEARAHREEIREERRRERERELRLERVGRRQGKATRDEERDVSERIALGMKGAAGTAETQYDQRLFNQSQGMDSGFGNDESYSLYDKPLFQGSSAAQIYRPKKGGALDDEEPPAAGDDAKERKGRQRSPDRLDTSRFRPDKAFAGAEGKRADGPRARPVEFESEPTADPFGLDEFLRDAKAGRPADKRRDRSPEKADPRDASPRRKR